ncbi:Cysteine-rich protein 2-binding protein [Smittium mucronatum]|uniref:Cysteine-rich protein 2-binding protein n=1 Tax=Smittium mucronatum TaxID=133383 RepID=A0A1R0H676_9FUNG|nr:Cysteine-rich protein 2-binding protein [Smittium mucronatum]
MDGPLSNNTAPTENNSDELGYNSVPPTTNHKARQITEKKEWQVLSLLQLKNSDLPAVVKRYRRKLQLRRLKRMIGAKMLVNVDQVIANYVKSQKPFEPWAFRDSDCISENIVTEQSKRIEHFLLLKENLLSDNPVSINDPSFSSQNFNKQSANTTTTNYENSFLSRLYGKSCYPDYLVYQNIQISPFHGRILRPFIWSLKIEPLNYPPRIKLNKLILTRAHPLLRKQLGSLKHTSSYYTDEYVSFCYFNKIHLDQVNELLTNSFWPGIDMSEALSCPEFSIIAVYKRKVVGCAFLTPDAYLTYIAVASGFNRIGIASYMLFQLIQSLPTKDITLHVQATNPAMILYQKFGFKPEKFVLDFYSAYYPVNSSICKNSFFMRLRRI